MYGFGRINKSLKKQEKGGMKMGNYIAESEFQEEIAELMEKGSKMERLNHYPRDGEKVTLKIEKDFLPYLHETVDLLSPYKYHQRTLLFMYIEELIQLFDKVKEERILHADLLSTCETLLLALDYLSNERFINSSFTEEDRTEIYSILEDAFEPDKKHSFSNNASRPAIQKEKIMYKEDASYVMDQREDRIRLYLAVYYKKTSTTCEHFRNVGKWLGEINIKPDSGEMSYEEYLAGMTNHGLHQEHLFYLNMVKRAFSWLFNSYSWRENKLMLFDELELYSKLGIKLD